MKKILTALHLPMIAVMVAVVTLCAPTQARADFIVRVTDLNSATGLVTAFDTSAILTSSGDGSGGFVVGLSAGAFTLNIVTDTATTGPGFTSANEQINTMYTSAAGNGNDELIVEILADEFMNPTAPTPSFISSNGSPSTTGLNASSVIMTSGVLAGNVIALNGIALGDTYSTLGNQLGETTGTGSIGSASSVLNPNPVSGAAFNIVNPFSFYQTYTINGFTNSGTASGSLSAGSTVSPVPEPSSVLLILSSLPVFGGVTWLRRKAVNA